MSKLTGEIRISDDHYTSKTEYERTSKIFTRGLVPSDRPLRILDVGCGTGLNAERLAAAGHTVVGIDVSPVAIEQFRAKGFDGFVHDITVDAPGGQLRPASFDLVFASEVIEHVPDTDRFLRNVEAALRPGGWLVLSTPNSAFWAYRVMAVLGQTPSEFQHPGHVRFFSKRSLVSAIRSAGFDVATVAARHMYAILGASVGDPLSPLLKLFGFQIEPRFATGGHFWQVSRFARHASGLWADTLIIVARKPGAA
jgi:2-polyprenyl-3-methyl-5-hydroxy-6-metoxy-1,4-benzoquinol methylase